MSPHKAPGSATKLTQMPPQSVQQTPSGFSTADHSNCR